MQAILDEAYTLATQGIAKDPDWPACLACAVTDRARAREGVQREGVCTTCFEKYCWGDSGNLATGGNGTGTGSGKVSGNGAERLGLGATMTVLALVLAMGAVLIF